MKPLHLLSISLSPNSVAYYVALQVPWPGCCLYSYHLSPPPPCQMADIIEKQRQMKKIKYNLFLFIQN